MQPVIPTFSGESDQFLIFQHELTVLAKRAGCDDVFTKSVSSNVEVGEIGVPLTIFPEKFGVQLVRKQLGAWDFCTFGARHYKRAQAPCSG